MANYLTILLRFIAAFAMIALASRQIGQFFVRARFPLISGFLFAGIVAGPYILGLISAEAVKNLRFVDEISLGFIAFAAGSELYLKEVRSRLKSIGWVTAGQVFSTVILGSLALFYLADFIPFMQPMSVSNRIAVSLLAGAILVARSPSSTIAVVNELRAKGPFTQMMLGVTIITDVVVIVLFAINSSIADGLLTNLGFDAGFVILLLAELSFSLVLGYLLGQILNLLLAQSFSKPVKTSLILLAGYGVFVLSATVREYSHTNFSFEILLEPLLICMVAGFLVSNFSRYRLEFMKILEEAGPLVYIAFFTLTGASLALDVLARVWPIALALFVIRLGAIFVGAFSGGVMAGEPMLNNRISWMAFVTQAGIGLGLSKEVAVTFPEWGTAFATVMISVIVINQIVGPPFLKWAINIVNEGHTRAQSSKFDGMHDAIIFGLEGQSLALARHLRSHGWGVKLATRLANQVPEASNPDNCIFPINDLSLETLHLLDAEQADTIITMLSDEDNYQICELAYEHFGTKNLVVRLNNHANFERFRELGALVVNPVTAIVSLLDHFVRSPSIASVLLDMEEDQDIIDVEVRDPDLHGVALRDLRLPLDTLILSVHRNGHTLISHGYTRLELGDEVTLMGKPKSLEEVSLRFEV